MRKTTNITVADRLRYLSVSTHRFIAVLFVVGLSCASLLLCSCHSGATHSKVAPVSLTYRLVGNDISRGVMEAEFVVVNTSADTLFADWLIGYNHISVAPLAADSSPLSVVQIQASYHQLRPTDSYKPLAPRDSMVVRQRYRGAQQRVSMSPCRPFFVRRGQLVGDITYKVLTSADGSEYRRKVPQFPYADGEWMYTYNRRQTASAPSDSAILPLIPSPKSVEYLGTYKVDVRTLPVRYADDSSLSAEHYSLRIGADGVTIVSGDAAGRYYAEQTLRMLRESCDSLRCCVVDDGPDFSHRGLMLDLARNFLGKGEIERVIDVMAMYKLNVLHLHLTDDEGWRLEIPGLEELTTVGSRRGYTIDEHDCLFPMYSGGGDPDDVSNSGNGYLTRGEFVELLRYAATRHIRVIPEVDMPGHSRAAIKAMNARYAKYIETDSVKANEYLLCDFADTSRYLSAQHYTDNVMCIALPSCYSFARKVISEIVAMYADAGAPLSIFHVGGDEVPRGAWLGSPKVAEYMQGKRQLEKAAQMPNALSQLNSDGVSAVDVANLKDDFLEALMAILDTYGLQIAGWEEIAYRAGHPNPRFANRNALTYCWNSVPEWRGDEKPYVLANAGYPVMICCVTNLYLDMCYVNHEQEQGLNWGGYVDEYQSFLLRPHDLYRSVEHTMQGQPRDLCRYREHKQVRLNPEAAPLICGVQAQLWSETLRSTDDLERYLFPKLLGVAERAWHADADFDKREEDLCRYNKQIWGYEMPRLHRCGLHFHLSQPGIHVAADTVTMNVAAEGAVIRYTLDGSEPDEQSLLYSTPFALPADCRLINARAFLLGEQSNITHHSVL